jgi:hypothetical protein
MKHFALAFEHGSEHGNVSCRVFFFAKSVYAPAEMQSAPSAIQFLRCQCQAEGCPMRDWMLVDDHIVERSVIGTAVYLLGTSEISPLPINDDDKKWVLGLVSSHFSHERWSQLSDLFDQAITEAMLGGLISGGSDV